MEIVYRNLSEIKPNPKNPRKGTKEAVEKLAESIKGNPKFFEARPILLSDRTGELVIIGGERRSEAARLLGMETVPTILLSGLTESQEDEILIKDNTHAGVWDEQKLQAWGKEQLQGWNVDGVKWPKPETEIKEDNFDPDKKVKSRVKPGELWQLGKHRLMCGDATNQEDVDKLMNGTRADLLLTDPPYNVDYASKNETLNAAGKGSHIQTDIVNDKMTDAEFSELLEQSFRNATENLKPGGAFYVWTAQGHRQIDVALALDKNGLFFRQQIIWVKNNLVLGRMDYQGKHEPCLYGWKEGAGHTFADTRTETTVINEDKPHLSDLHPTTKPVPLFARLVGNSTKEGEIVLDLFGGSGTSLVACEQLGRRCYTMELDPHYCDVILTRWEQFTGKKAQKITG